MKLYWALSVISLVIYTACSSTGAGVSPPVQAAPEQAAPLETTPAAPAAKDEFVVTKEVFSRTFDEIEAFIDNLNEIIRSKDYETWTRYLSTEYIRKTSDLDFLKAQSEAPVLKKSNIQLSDLRDYFEYVVVPSRSQAQVDDIEFIDESHVKAISVINDTRGLLYLLVREGDNWRIGVW